MHLKKIIGDKWQVYAGCESEEKCQILDFLNEIPSNMVKYKDRLLNIFEQASATGPRHFNNNISHQIDEKNSIWEFIAGRLRVLWFYDNGKLIVCSNIFVKSTKKTPKSEKMRAISFKKKYLQQKKDGNIHFEADD